MKKNKALSCLVMSLIISIVFFTGCSLKSNNETDSGNIKDKQVEITWWNYPNYNTGTTGDFERKIIENFNKKYPNIKVNLEMIDFSTGPQRVYTSISTNTAPDLIYDFPGRIIDYARNGVMAPLDDIFTDEFKNDIPSNILDASKSGDNYYMYPLNTAPNMMVFNKTMLDKAGLTSMLPLNKEDRLWTNEEYYSLLKAIKEKVPGIVAPTAIYLKSSAGDQGTRPYIANMGGGEIISKDLSKYIFNSSGNIEALQWIVDSTKSGLTLKGAENLTSDDVANMFLEEKIAATPLYNSVLKSSNQSKKTSDFEEVYIPYPTPSLAQKPFIEAYIGGIGIVDNGKPDKIEASKKFIDFIANDPETFKDNLIATGGFSVRSSVTGLYDDDEAKYSESMIKYLGVYYNATQGFAEMRTYYFPTLQEVFLGEKTHKEALDYFVSKANEALTRD